MLGFCWFNAMFIQIRHRKECVEKFTNGLITNGYKQEWRRIDKHGRLWCVECDDGEKIKYNYNQTIDVDKGKINGESRVGGSLLTLS